jgi:hypothetical protein
MGAHKCSQCHRVAHATCGTVQGEEGYGCDVICFVCVPQAVAPLSRRAAWAIEARRALDEDSDSGQPPPTTNPPVSAPVSDSIQPPVTTNPPVSASVSSEDEMSDDAPIHEDPPSPERLDEEEFKDERENDSEEGCGGETDENADISGSEEGWLSDMEEDVEYEEKSMSTCFDWGRENRSQPRYVQSLLDESGIHILQRPRVENAYARDGDMGLFHMFISIDFLRSIRQWSVEHSSSAFSLTIEELRGYVGLELAMSLVQMNSISDYWARSKMFSGHPDFSCVMGRTRFQNIRASLQFRCHASVTHLEKVQDPLWFSRVLLEHLQRNCAYVAVPKSCSALDENSAAYKGRSKARSYMPSKPDKYAIRFYAVVGSGKGLYLHSIHDNGRGNSSATTPASRFSSVFPEMRTPLRNALLQFNTTYECGIKLDSASALWLSMICQQTQKSPSPSGRRIVVMDNFYTRHTLAVAAQILTDGEVKVIGM